METHTHVLLQNAEYDIYSSDQLERELSVLVSGAATVDFVNVSYIDSTALTRLISALKRMRSSDASSELTLTNVRPSVRRLFDLTGLVKVFKLE